MSFSHIIKSIFLLLTILSAVFCSPCTDSEPIDSPITTIVDTLINYDEVELRSVPSIDLSVCNELNVLQNSRFYHFNSDAMNHLFIDHCNVLGHVSNVDPISIAVYKGSCDNLVCVEFYGNLCGINGGEFGIDIEQYTDYYIAVYGPAVDFIFDMRLSFALKNDNCEDAIEVTGGNLYSSSSAHATIDGYNFCFIPSSNIWYSFTTSDNDTFALISFCRYGAESILDNFITLMKGDNCDAGTCIAYEDNNCGLSPELFIEVEPNTHYIFEIGTKGRKGEFTFYFDLVSYANGNICDIAEDIAPASIYSPTTAASVDSIAAICGF